MTCQNFRVFKIKVKDLEKHSSDGSELSEGYRLERRR